MSHPYFSIIFLGFGGKTSNTFYQSVSWSVTNNQDLISSGSMTDVLEMYWGNGIVPSTPVNWG